MFVTYTPENGDTREWSVYPRRMRTHEQEAIERAFDDSFGAWSIAVQSGSAKARRVLLWVLLRRDHKALKLADVDVAWDELVVENSREELQALLDMLKTKADDPGVVAAVEAQLETARSDEAMGGKAPLPIVG